MSIINEKSTKVSNARTALLLDFEKTTVNGMKNAVYKIRNIIYASQIILHLSSGSMIHDAYFTYFSWF